VSGNSERPELLAPSHRLTAEEIREMVGGATPHFALQLRDRIERLIEPLPPDHPARLEGQRQLRRLEQLAETGVTEGTVQEHEQPLPSLKLPAERTGH